MIYYTGDIHGSPLNITRFAKQINLCENDTIVILGDVGANYYMNDRDTNMKNQLSQIKATVFCIHGNHENRPSNIPSYKQKEWNGGLVWYEEAFPSILFAKDGDIYTMEGIRHLVIGGAYSVDKYYRLAKGHRWWADEQPSPETKEYVEHQIQNNRIEVVLSHTCPFKYEPIEQFLNMVDQSTVDDSTEHWLDKIESEIDYKAWFCGHWHTDKRIDKMHFLYTSFESAEMIQKGE